jgi:long-chain fatty acid transport protein
MRRSHAWLAAGGLVAAMAVPLPLVAQGFSVNEHSTCAMGRAGTGAAMPCPDGSAMAFNPAGLASLEKGHGIVTANATVIAARGGFTNASTGFKDDLNDNNYLVPAAYVGYGITENIAAGVGLFAPYGLTTEWASSSQARFLGYKSHIAAIYVQPTVAAKLGKYVKVGFGFDINFFKVELRQHVDLAEVGLPASAGAPPGTTFGNIGFLSGTDIANTKLEGNATGVGYHAGVILQATDNLSFGVRYLSRQRVEVNDGNATFSQINTGILLPNGNPLGLPAMTSLDVVLAPQFQPGGALVDQGVSTAVRLPEQWSVGLAYQVSPALVLLFDYNRQNWEVFQSLPFDFEILSDQSLPQNFQSTDTFRFGADYRLGTSSNIRIGYISHNAAAPDETVTPNLPEASRSEFTAGFGTGFAKNFHLDLAYQYIDQVDREGRTTPAGTANNGLFEFYAHLFGASLSYNF